MDVARWLGRSGADFKVEFGQPLAVTNLTPAKELVGNGGILTDSGNVATEKEMVRSQRERFLLAGGAASLTSGLVLASPLPRTQSSESTALAAPLAADLDVRRWMGRKSADFKAAFGDPLAITNVPRDDHELVPQGGESWRWQQKWGLLEVIFESRGGDADLLSLQFEEPRPSSVDEAVRQLSLPSGRRQGRGNPARQRWEDDGGLVVVVDVEQTESQLDAGGFDRSPRERGNGRARRLLRAASGTLRSDNSFIVGAGFRHLGTRLGFFNAAPISKQTVSGSWGANAALSSLISALATLGLFTDNTDGASSQQTRTSSTTSSGTATPTPTPDRRATPTPTPTRTPTPAPKSPAGSRT